jgi:hypothetical protein
MAGLDPAICRATAAGGDGRDKPGNDGFGFSHPVIKRLVPKTAIVAIA